MKQIQYDNFGTRVQGPVPTPAGEVMVLELTDRDSGEIHVFAYPVADAERVGMALAGKAVVTAPASALDALRGNGGGGTPPRAG